MKLRFIEDRRSLLWALLLFPLAPALVYRAPESALYLLPLELYLAYCAGVLAHNHSHAPVFVSRRANELYSAWLSLFYGCPLFVWEAVHQRNHHRHLNGPGDVTRTSRYGERFSLLTALSYPARSARWQLPLIFDHLARTRIKAPRRFRAFLGQIGVVLGGHAALLALGLALHGPALGALSYFLAFGLPALFAPWSMMVTNYLQHVGCDASSPDDHSRNFTHPLFNWLFFDNGFHTVHHDQSALHWSRLRARHAERAGAIDPQLNQRTPLGYVVGALSARARQAQASDAQHAREGLDGPLTPRAARRARAGARA